MFAWIGRLWRSANFWRISPVEGVRTGSALAGGLMFLFMLFAIIGTVLVMLGFDLNAVDIWLEAQGGWLDLVGKIALRALLGVILFFCVFSIGGWFWQIFFERENPDKMPWWIVLIALPLGYCSAVNIVAPL